MKADRIVLGFSIVVIGIVWFLVNLGVMPAIRAQELWRYWPVLLILWGFLLLFGKGNGSSGCLVAMLVMFLFFGGFFAVFFPIHRGPIVEIERNWEMMSGVETYQLELTLNAGEFSLQGHAADTLLRANIASPAAPEISERRSGNTAQIIIRDESRSWSIGTSPSRWELSLAEGVPAEISLRTGATRADLDLSLLKVKKLNVTAGAGELTIRLGQTDTEIFIESGAGSITIYVPDETGVRLRTSGGLLTVRGESARIISMGDRYYESRDLEAKEVLADIEIKAGAGTVTLKNR